MDANNIKNTVDLNTIKKLVSNEIHENNFQKNTLFLRKMLLIE